MNKYVQMLSGDGEAKELLKAILIEEYGTDRVKDPVHFSKFLEERDLYLVMCGGGHYIICKNDYGVLCSDKHMLFEN